MVIDGFDSPWDAAVGAVGLAEISEFGRRDERVMEYRPGGSCRRLAGGLWGRIGHLFGPSVGRSVGRFASGIGLGNQVQKRLCLVDLGWRGLSTQ